MFSEVPFDMDQVNPLVNADLNVRLACVLIDQPVC